MDLICLHEQHFDLIGGTVAISQLKGVLVRRSAFQVRIRPVLQQKLDHAQVYLKRFRVHAHRNPAEVHQQGPIHA